MRLLKLWRSLRSVALLIPIGLAFAGSVHALPVLYGVTSGFGSGSGSGGFSGSGPGTGGGNKSFLVTVDQSNGTVTDVGELGLGGGISSLAVNSAGTFFTARGGRLPGVPNKSPSESMLVTVEPNTATATLVGKMGIEKPTNFDQFGSQRQNIADLAVRSDGALFGIVGRGDQLARIDTTNGTTTKVGDTFANGRGNGLAFDASDNLFLANDTHLYTVDQSTGVATASVALDFTSLTTQPQTGASDRVGGMTFGPDGKLYATVLAGQGDDGQPFKSILATLDTSNGKFSEIGSITRKLESLAFVDDGKIPAAPATDPISAFDFNTFAFRDTRTANQSGFFVGDRLAFGIDRVTPNPEQGLGGRGTTVTAVQNGQSFNVPFLGGLFEGEYFDSIPRDTNLLGPWQLTVDNPGSANGPIVVDTHAIGDVGANEFVNTLSVDGGTTDGVPTPTFNWTLPSLTQDSVRIFITDFTRDAHGNLINPGFTHGAKIIHRVTLPSNATSFTVPEILEDGSSLQPGHNYELLVQLDEHRQFATGGDSLISRSRAFFGFTPLAAGAPEVFLPSVGAHGVFHFDVAVQKENPIIIDPFVATGYDYAIGAGDPLFSSVKILSDVGDGLYDLYLFDANLGDFAFAQMLHTDELFNFAGAGIDKFRILGIETSAGLNPADVSAFMTQVSFASSGRFTGTMTPISQFVPEPDTIVLLVLGLIGLGFAKTGEWSPQA